MLADAAAAAVGHKSLPLHSSMQDDTAHTAVTQVTQQHASGHMLDAFLPQAVGSNQDDAAAELQLGQSNVDVPTESHAAQQHNAETSVQRESSHSKRTKQQTTAGQTIRGAPSQAAEQATQPTSAALQHYDSAPEFMQATLNSGSTTARRSTSPTMLRNQHLPGMTLHHRAAFPSTMSMRHEAGTLLGQGRQPRVSLGQDHVDDMMMLTMCYRPKWDQDSNALFHCLGSSQM